jgi:hypothetical protein
MGAINTPSGLVYVVHTVHHVHKVHRLWRKAGTESGDSFHFWLRGLVDCVGKGELGASQIGLGLIKSGTVPVFRVMALRPFFNCPRELVLS